MAMHTSVKANPSLVPLPQLDPLCERSIDRLLKAVGPIQSMSVTVAGPLAGAAMSSLWRRGVQRVEAARRITSPSADQLSEVLLLIGCTSVDHISESLGYVLPILAPGGVLGIDAHRIAAVSERSRLCQMLAHRGLRYRAGMELHADIIARKPDLTEVFALAS
jgi:hypothetical protein